MHTKFYVFLARIACVILILMGILIWTGFKTEPQPNSAQTALPHPLFYESFDSFDSINANGGAYRDITLEHGKKGKAVLIEGNRVLSYPVKNHFNFRKGTIEFWVKPKWDGNTTQAKYFYRIIWNKNQNLDISLGHIPDIHNGTSQNYLNVQFNDHGVYNRRTRSIVPMQWKPDEWHKVIIYWDFTLHNDINNKNKSYLVYRIDDIFAKCVFVPPVVDEAMGSDARIIVGQDNTVGKYPVNALLDELKIYDTSLLPVVPFPAFQFNPQKPGTEDTFRKLFANDGFCSCFETYNDAPHDCPKLDDRIQPTEKVFFFQRPAFERVYENYVPKEEEIDREFNYQAAPGEFETLFFNVYSRINLNNAKLTNTEFKGTSNSISKGNIDLRAVRNWFQAGTGVDADQLPLYVPELLLHNDQIRYELDPKLSLGHIPSIPILDHVETRITQYTTRQFALIVHVPKDTPAGSYVGFITLKADGIPAQTTKLNLEVLPFTLRDPGKRFTIFHGTWPSNLYAHNQDSYRWQIFAKELQDIRNHGFNGLILATSNDAGEFPHMREFDIRKKKVEMARIAGFKWLVLEQVFDPKKFAQQITPAYRDLLINNGFEPYFMGLCEIAWDSSYIPANIQNYIAIARLIHGIGAKVVGGGSRAYYERLKNPHDPVYASFPGTVEPFDWGLYFAYAPQAAQYWVDIMRGERKKDQNVIETTYYSAQNELPQWNRYYCGYFLWVTGLDGCAPHAYQGVAGTNWYNDFAFFPYADPNRRFRPGPLAYPSKQGPVPTFQWEATREGIKDLKYLATWKYYKDQVAKTNPSLATNSETVVNNLLEHYKDRDNTWNPAVFRVSMAQYEADRKTIIGEIKKLYKERSSR